MSEASSAWVNPIAARSAKPAPGKQTHPASRPAARAMAATSRAAAATRGSSRPVPRQAEKSDGPKKIWVTPGVAVISAAAASPAGELDLQDQPAVVAPATAVVGGVAAPAGGAGCRDADAAAALGTVGGEAGEPGGGRRVLDPRHHDRRGAGVERALDPALACLRHPDHRQRRRSGEAHQHPLRRLDADRAVLEVDQREVEAGPGDDLGDLRARQTEPASDLKARGHVHCPRLRGGRPRRQPKLHPFASLRELGRGQGRRSRGRKPACP